MFYYTVIYFVNNLHCHDGKNNILAS